MDLEPKIYSLKKRFPHTRFKTVNATINKEIAAQFNVFSFPTVLVFYEGQESIRMVRNFSVQELEGKMNRIYQLLFG
jgi:thioredoxin-like negative regulator of GroEL